MNNIVADADQLSELGISAMKMILNYLLSFILFSLGSKATMLVHCAKYVSGAKIKRLCGKAYDIHMQLSRPIIR